MTAIRNKRPFVLSRSSFLSTGKHSAKWTGDNTARWDDLKSSIVSIMDFNLFDVPMIGADICGFMEDTNEELCARWIEAGAFYTFSRNHNTNGAASQELYLWESVTTAAKNALNMRYQLLPVLYTLFYQAQVTGATVIRSLWYDTPSDQTALGVDTQFMWGSSVMISPVLEQGAVTVNAYFPMGLWYAFSTDPKQRALAVDASSGGVYKSLDTPLTAVNVHVQGGNILPLTDSTMTIAATRESGFTLLVALCPGGRATGELFWDDGEQVALTNYTLVKYNAVVGENGKGLVAAVVEHDSYAESTQFKVKAVQVLGLSTQIKQQPKEIKLNGLVLDVSAVQYDANKSSLYFSGLDVVLSEAMTLTWN